MKTFALCKAWTLLCGLLLVGSAAAASPDAVRLQVLTPPVWRVLPEQRFSDLFAGSLRDALASHGYTQPLAVLGAMEDPAQVPYLLTVTITDWRVTDFGNITCSFSARLRTPAGERPLGDFPGTVWSPGVIYPNGGHAYYPLSGTAIRDLGARLVASGLPREQFFSRTEAGSPSARAAFTAPPAASTL